MLNSWGRRSHVPCVCKRNGFQWTLMLHLIRKVKSSPKLPPESSTVLYEECFFWGTTEIYRNFDCLMLNWCQIWATWPRWNLCYSYLGCDFASVLGVTATVLSHASADAFAHLEHRIPWHRKSPPHFRVAGRYDRAINDGSRIEGQAPFGTVPWCKWFFSGPILFKFDGILEYHAITCEIVVKLSKALKKSTLFLRS